MKRNTVEKVHATIDLSARQSVQIGIKMEKKTFGFIGLGLIGGSVAKAIRKNIENAEIIAFDSDFNSLYAAQAEGICDAIYTQLTDAFSVCDYIFLCTPVSYNNKYLSLLKNIKRPSCILTDVGSVKCSIEGTIKELALEDCFIGGHPMAGSEHNGYAASSSLLLENAYYILSPGSGVPVEKLAEFHDLIAALGAIPLVLSATEHDHVTSAVSHLPHMIAFSLVNLIQDSDDGKNTMKRIAAGGFKDITRIASSSGVMWQQICEENKTELLSMMDSYLAAFGNLRDKIANEDQEYLHRYFTSAKEYRDSFDEVTNGPISRSYYISVAIPDETGAIASISSLFAQRNISIKNIGIIHNREYEEGALRIEFYDEAALKAAILLLKEQHYHTYTK